jgi:carboxypeptidase PM20D1
MMGWIYSVLLLIVVVVIIVLVRTYLMKSRQVRGLKADDIGVNIDEAALHLSEAIQIPSLSFVEEGEVDSRPFTRLRTLLEKQFPRVHAALKKEIIAGDSLLFTWVGSNPDLKPVLLMAHMDVVPVLDEPGNPWTEPPFSGNIKDGFIWGRGSLDDKHALMGILEAVEYLLGQGVVPQRTVMLAFGHDEEVGGLKGAAAISSVLARRGVRLEFILDEGGAIVRGLFGNLTVAALGIAEKGYVTIKLTMEGKAGHSSQPPAHTTIGLLSAAIQMIEARPHPLKLQGVIATMLDYLGPEMRLFERLIMANRWLFAPLVTNFLAKQPSIKAMMHTTQAVTIIAGGTKDNILPPSASAAVNCRVIPGETVQQTVDFVRAAAGNPELKVEPVPGFCNEPSSISSVESPAFQLLQHSISQVFPEAVVAPYLVTGGTDTKHYADLSDAIFRFSPAVMTSEDLRRIHGRDERIGILVYKEMIHFYTQLLLNSITK